MRHHPSKKKKPLCKRESREVGRCRSGRTDGYLCFNTQKAVKECPRSKIWIVSLSFKWNHIVRQPVSRTDAAILMVAPPWRLLKYIHYIKHKRAFLLRFDLREFTYIHPSWEFIAIWFIWWRDFPDSLTAGSVHHLLQAADRQQIGERKITRWRRKWLMTIFTFQMNNIAGGTLLKWSAASVLGEMSKSFKAPGTTGIDSACQEPPVLYWTFRWGERRGGEASSKKKCRSSFREVHEEKREGWN